MEIITIIVILFLMAYLNSIQEYRIMKIIFCLVVMVIGLNIMISGITWGTTTIVSIMSNEAIMLFVILTLGSLMTAYAVAINEKEE